MLDATAEWRYYGDDEVGENPSRCGMPINARLPESSLGCIVKGGQKNFGEFRRIQRYVQWQSMPYGEKKLYDNYQHITTMATIAGLPKKICEEACRYHQQISEHKTFRGDNRDAIIAASIYIACRAENYPRTSKEIAHMFNLDYSSATKGCKNAMTIINELTDVPTYTVTSATSFIERYCSKIGMGAAMTAIAKFISLQLEKQNLIPENTPHAVASGIIYFVIAEFELPIDKSSICHISDISDVTIVKCFKKIKAHKDKILVPEIYLKYAKKNA
jgi:transcription initiation factor TFIIB